MEKLFILYRYLANSRDEYETHQKAFDALDTFVEMLEHVEAWEDEYSRKGYLLESQATALREQIYHKCEEVLVEHDGGIIEAMKAFARSHLPYHDYDALILHLQEEQKKIAMYRHPVPSEGLGDLDDHPFGGREPEERSPYSGNDLDDSSF